jgi:hypothetical protein
MLIPLLIAIGLLVISVVLIATHLRTWRQAKSKDLEERERQFAWRQFRRRMQTSAMIALVAVSIPIGMWLTENADPGVALAFWGGTLLLVLWIMLLALADAVASKQHFGRDQQLTATEIARLHGEMRKMRPEGQNGEPEE